MITSSACKLPERFSACNIEIRSIGVTPIELSALTRSFKLLFAGIAIMLPAALLTEIDVFENPTVEPCAKAFG